MRNRIGALLNREDGASMIVIMLVAVGLFLTVPVFVDYASLHYTRRVTQTGADAASLAAAIEYADHLSIQWPYGDGALGVAAAEICCFGQLCVYSMDWSKICSAAIYELYVMIEGSDDGIGKEEAKDYAERNGTEMKEYAANPVPFVLYELPRIHIVANVVPIMPVAVLVEVERRAPMIYRTLYGRNDFKVRADARAEAYMNSYQESVMPCLIICCSCNPYGCVCASQVPAYDFKWKVRLVE